MTKITIHETDTQIQSRISRKYVPITKYLRKIHSYLDVWFSILNDKSPSEAIWWNYKKHPSNRE